MTNAPLYPDRCRKEPWAHQRVGTMEIVNETNQSTGRVLPGCLALFDDTGLGKSKQVVDAACLAFERDEVDAVIVVAPAYARSVWASPDPLLGEVAQHAWDGVPYGLYEYCSRFTKLPDPSGQAPRRRLHVVATNYEFLRRDARLGPLMDWAKARRTWLVLDESWCIQNPHAQQTKACMALRKVCCRAVPLNATPGTPEQTFSQFHLMDEGILGCKNFYVFRARYCRMGGWNNKEIVGYQRMDEYQRKTAPYAIRRLAKDCLDLPPVLPPITIEARLTPQTWALYKDMRDELVAYIHGHPSEAPAFSAALQAGVRTLRLAQILAGFLGGVEEAGDEDSPEGSHVREIGREKLDAVLTFLAAQDVNKAVVWGRFRCEMLRTAAALRATGANVYMLYGQQKPDDREAAKRAFAPGGNPATCPERLVGHPAAGGAGINLAGADLAIWASNAKSLRERKQADGRLNRPGQTRPVRFADVIAVGPDGQKTLDHAVVAAFRKDEEVATWTAQTWLRALSE